MACPAIERSVPAAALRRDRKWTRYPKADTTPIADAPVLSDYFTIKRGLATGDNSYFILPAEEVERRKLPQEAFRPILPSPRYVSEDEIPADSDGNPLLERRLYLLDCRLTESDIKIRHPSLWEYLEEGKSQTGRQALHLPSPEALVRPGDPSCRAAGLHLPRSQRHQEGAAVPIHPEQLPGDRGQRLPHAVSKAAARQVRRQTASPDAASLGIPKRHLPRRSSRGGPGLRWRPPQT